MTSTKASAAQRWRDVQQARAVPTEILAAAQHSPGSTTRRTSGRRPRGVVMELTAQHPMSWLDPLWVRFHDLHRGEPATADDAVAVLTGLGITPDGRSLGAGGPTAGGPGMGGSAAVPTGGLDGRGG
ncbi:MAG: hypothetical protein M3Z25_17265 [Actinomycetota bacterium]|nr:hypothetical protein [Actinomycetota bacterium]